MQVFVLIVAWIYDVKYKQIFTHKLFRKEGEAKTSPNGRFRTERVEKGGSGALNSQFFGRIKLTFDLWVAFGSVQIPNHRTASTNGRLVGGSYPLFHPNHHLHPYQTHDELVSRSVLSAEPISNNPVLFKR
jgi:hypothetical protein